MTYWSKCQSPVAFKGIFAHWGETLWMCIHLTESCLSKDFIQFIIKSIRICCGDISGHDRLLHLMHFDPVLALCIPSCGDLCKRNTTYKSKYKSETAAEVKNCYHKNASCNSLLWKDIRLLPIKCFKSKGENALSAHILNEQIPSWLNFKCTSQT